MKLIDFYYTDRRENILDLVLNVNQLVSLESVNDGGCCSFTFCTASGVEYVVELYAAWDDWYSKWSSFIESKDADQQILFTKCKSIKRKSNSKNKSAYR